MVLLTQECKSFDLYLIRKNASIYKQSLNTCYGKINYNNNWKYRYWQSNYHLLSNCNWIFPFLIKLRHMCTCGQNWWLPLDTICECHIFYLVVLCLIECFSDCDKHSQTLFDLVDRLVGRVSLMNSGTCKWNQWPVATEHCSSQFGPKCCCLLISS